jgi:NlpC/P60 family putative phage cell wall peptidase
VSAQGDVVVSIARTWIGTPYVHQASLRGAGCDCLGLVRGVFRELVGIEPERVPPYTPDWSEAGGEETLWQAARRHLRELTHVQPVQGHVVLMRMRDGVVAKHVGIIGSLQGTHTLIHAYSGRGVVETPLSEPWRRRIVAVFAYPGE